MLAEKLKGYFAAPDGAEHVSCLDPSEPGTLANAVRKASKEGAYKTVYIRLSQAGQRVSFRENLTGNHLVNADITFDTYLNGNNPTTGIDGIAALDGDLTIGSGNTLKLAANLELHLISENSVLEMRQDAEMAGPGFLVFSANTRSHFIQLGDPSVGCSGASPKIAIIENLRIDKIGGTVTVRDQCQIDDESDLFITNRLEVLNGVLDMLDNNLHLVGPTNDNGIAGGVEIGAGAVIQGDGTFFISVDPAALGGPRNMRTDAYLIAGDGNLNMAFDKITDAGACIDLCEIGNGGISYNRAGALYIREATQHRGTFRNEGIARTEFDKALIVTGNLEIEGPNGEVFPGDGVSQSGDESGVYFFSPVTINDQINFHEGTVCFFHSITNPPKTDNELRKVFFISYNQADKAWAESIAWILEDAGYKVVIQSWDFRPGGNFVLDMQEAVSQSQKIIVILSQNYLNAEFTHPEWATAFARDPQGRERALIPFRVAECNPSGLLGSITYVDLVSLSEDEIKKGVLGAFSERAKPSKAPSFPSSKGIEPSIQTLDSVVDEHKPPVAETDLRLWRFRLTQKLNKLPPEKLNMIIYTSGSPPKRIPEMPANKMWRITSLLDWAHSPEGCGFDIIESMLNESNKG